MKKDRQVVRPIENTLILCLRATQTEPYLAMCHTLSHLLGREPRRSVKLGGQSRGTA